MSKRKRIAKLVPDGWRVTTELKVNSRWLTPGTEFRVRGERGRFLFERFVETSTSSWVDARTIDGRFRSFHKEKISRVHAKSKTRKNV